MLEEHHEGRETELAHATLESCPSSSYDQSSAAWGLEGASCPSPEESIGTC